MISQGVVNLGPSHPSTRASIQFSTISGIRITGRYTGKPHVANSYADVDANDPGSWNKSVAEGGYEQCGMWSGQQVRRPPAPSLVPPNPALCCSTDRPCASADSCRWLGPQAAFGHDGSVGLCLDSSQPVSAGACYQNTIRDLVITAVDVGLYAGKWVNVRDPAHFLLLLLCLLVLLFRCRCGS